jgi:hypothetical protein
MNFSAPLDTCLRIPEAHCIFRNVAPAKVSADPSWCGLSLLDKNRGQSSN